MSPSIKILAPLIIMFYTPQATHASFTKLKQIVYETCFSYLCFTGVRMDTKAKQMVLPRSWRKPAFESKNRFFKISIQCDNNQELIFITEWCSVLTIITPLVFNIKDRLNSLSVLKVASLNQELIFCFAPFGKEKQQKQDINELCRDLCSWPERILCEFFVTRALNLWISLQKSRSSNWIQ